MNREVSLQLENISNPWKPLGPFQGLPYPRRCAEMLEAANLLSDRQEEGEEHFFVSDHAENFSEVARLFLKTEELHASLVQIEDF